MGSGMNCEQAKEYAKTMTYKQAVVNVCSSKGIKYRKATMIKLRELAEIADRLDGKTETQEWWLTENSLDDFRSGFIHGYAQAKYEYESKTEPFDKGINVLNKTENPCDTCANKGDHNGECSNCFADSEPIRWKTPSRYKPKVEPQTDADFTMTYTCCFSDCENFKHFGFGEKCIECKRKQKMWKTEPQTDRSMAVGKRSDATADKYNLYGKTTTDEPQKEML